MTGIDSSSHDPLRTTSLISRGQLREGTASPRPRSQSTKCPFYSEYLNLSTSMNGLKDQYRSLSPPPGRYLVHGFVILASSLEPGLDGNISTGSLLQDSHKMSCLISAGHIATFAWFGKTSSNKTPLAMSPNYPPLDSTRAEASHT